jgi:MoxR-like ATPase
MVKDSEDIKNLELLGSAIKRVRTEIGKVIIGQNDVIDLLLVSLFAKGHVLLIGVPGLAKTLMIRTLSQVIDLNYSRIQFTPDLMPSDITGNEIIEENVSNGAKEFRFVRGPIFANIVLADEINRTPPKTQSALLEAMQEHEVTAAGTTYTLDEPFFVLATQNPIEQEGTYPLPEAQLDRFMFNIWLDYPSRTEEINIVKGTTTQFVPKVEKVLSRADMLKFQDLVRRVPVADNVIDFAVRLAQSTRPNANCLPIVKDFISYGAGPRASQYLVLGAKSKAALEGRFTPDINDVKAVAVPTLRHRIVANFNAEAENLSSGEIIERIVKDM